MSRPTASAAEKLRRVARYLTRNRRCVTLYRWAHDGLDIVLATDSDWATHQPDRRSNSGGLVTLNGHLLAHWCRAQPVVSLSSGESELHSSVAGLTRLVGLLHLFEFLRPDVARKVTHTLDSSAAKGITLRRGSGSVKHLTVKDLWGQEACAKYGIAVKKVPREANAADSLACYSSGPVLAQHLEMMEVYRFAQ